MKFQKSPGDAISRDAKRNTRDARAPEDAPLAEHLGRLLDRLSPKKLPELQQTVGKLIQANAEGHVCVSLSGIAGDDVTDLRDKLLDSGVVGRPGEFFPLILDDADRLYLHRLWTCEKIVGDAIASRLQQIRAVDEKRLQAGLDHYFGSDLADLQRRAAETAARHSFAIVSGGPGTGKTRTVLAILALLAEQSPEKPPRLALAAPTGKAAARLRESIQKAAASLTIPENIRALIPTEAQTIHRLLSSHGFQHRGREVLLPLDGIIVDEASMVDLPLLARLFRALPPTARVILLGDRHQLASVEAGAAFGDLCKVGGPLAERLVELRKSHRFGEDSGIFQTSRRIQAGDAEGVLELLQNAATPEVRGVEITRISDLPALLAAEAIPAFLDALEAADPAEALARMEHCRILCALRKGPFGVVGLNALMQRLLEDSGKLRVSGDWFAGRPVIITENDYEQSLFNGEMGLTWSDPEAGGELRVFFPGETPGGVRRFLPSALPPHETAFAMTIHRSQGSEFDRVLVILPPQDAPVLSRELLYTAVTRAKSQAVIGYQPEILKLAITRQVERTSGLRDRFGG